MNRPAPTPEQQCAIDRFCSGADFVIEAGAGETSTLRLLAETCPGLRIGRASGFQPGDTAVA